MKVSRKEMTGHQLAHQGQLFRATNSEKDQNSLTGTFIPGSIIILPQKTKQLLNYKVGINKNYLY